MRSRGTLLPLILLALSAFSNAQEYNGPPPPKADVPYLLHAENLIETESAVARQEPHKKDTAYVIEGPTSPARTPLAEPIFILKSENLQPQQIQLYRMEVKNGQRQTVFPNKRGKRTPRARYVTFRQLHDNIYWIEVNEQLDNGEYCLTPRASNDVFCFTVY